MDSDPEDMEGPAAGMATVLITGIERVVTTVTDVELQGLLSDDDDDKPNVMMGSRLRAVARLLELGIREYRTVAAQA